MSEEIFKPENFHFYEDGYPKDLQPFEACAMANAHIKPIIEEYERQLIEKSKEIGRAEHRGNTVDFIYDKVKIYSDLITKLQSDRAVLIECLSQYADESRWYLDEGAGMFSGGKDRQIYDYELAQEALAKVKNEKD